MEGSGTAIEVTTKAWPLSFFYLSKPMVTIDGTPQNVPWGRHCFDVGPGRHTVKVAFRYLWKADTGANSIEVDVPEGIMTRVRYSMPPWMFAKGSLKELPRSPARLDV